MAIITRVAQPLLHQCNSYAIYRKFCGNIRIKKSTRINHKSIKINKANNIFVIVVINHYSEEAL